MIGSWLVGKCLFHANFRTCFKLFWEVYCTSEDYIYSVFLYDIGSEEEFPCAIPRA